MFLNCFQQNLNSVRINRESVQFTQQCICCSVVASPAHCMYPQIWRSLYQLCHSLCYSITYTCRTGGCLWRLFICTSYVISVNPKQTNQNLRLLMVLLWLIRTSTDQTQLTLLHSLAINIQAICLCTYANIPLYGYDILSVQLKYKILNTIYTIAQPWMFGWFVNIDMESPFLNFCFCVIISDLFFKWCLGLVTFSPDVNINSNKYMDLLRLVVVNGYEPCMNSAIE